MNTTASLNGFIKSVLTFNPTQVHELIKKAFKNDRYYF